MQDIPEHPARHTVYGAAIIGIALLAPLKSISCMIDADCGPDARCAKRSGQIYGMCLSEATPLTDAGAQRDNANPMLQFDSSYGHLCSFDADCGPQRRCLKTSENANGVCVKGR